MHSLEEQPSYYIANGIQLYLLAWITITSPIPWTFVLRKCKSMGPINTAKLKGIESNYTFPSLLLIPSLQISFPEM